MREIKFRIFEEKTGKVERVLAIDWFFKTAITLKDPHGVGFRDKDYLLMQYTGLKDKNGVEIYEGDIIRAKFIKDDTTAIGRVSYFDKDTSFVCHLIDGDYARVNYLDDIKVIGNIYENPELLK